MRQLSAFFAPPLLLSVLLVSACVDEPVIWQDKTEMAVGHPSPLVFPAGSPRDSSQNDSSSAAQFARTQDLLREAGANSVLSEVLASMPESRQSIAAPAAAMLMPSMHNAVMPGAELGQGDMPHDSARCARSLRVMEAAGRGRVAVWWSRRSGGRVALVGAWQLNANESIAGRSASWRGPFNIDTLDQGAGDSNAGERGAIGCDRPAPGVAVDQKNGYVHVAYAINAPEGAGVFYAHQMDPRSPFEPPVVIVYGDRRLGAARVATSGDVVAVAYEDPNAPLDRARVALAVSRSAGHVFEARMDANRSGSAVDPYVQLRGRAAVVGWTEVDSSMNAATSFRMRRAVVRRRLYTRHHVDVNADHGGGRPGTNRNLTRQKRRLHALSGCTHDR
ncbi:MAG: hypothetical protein M3Y64_09010 [Gemmatimonadota bacterium]|nr:hypothetical protein [Gemmatimonadota bacterium]